MSCNTAFRYGIDRLVAFIQDESCEPGTAFIMRFAVRVRRV